MPELDIAGYRPEMKSLWDGFVKKAKNSTFLHMRDYLEYHADRFTDHSLLFFKNGTLKAVMPACRQDSDLISHAGLTYGGFLMDTKISAEDTLHFFFRLKDFLREEGFNRLIIKPTPHIYHAHPAEEDLYAIFRLGGQLSVRNISCTIAIHNPLRFRRDRVASLRNARNNMLTAAQSDDYPSFWEMLTDNLRARYNASPVHSSEEISRLAALFPENIKLYIASTHDGSPLAGCVVYISGDVVHTQYISSTEEGRAKGAVDFLLSHLITEVFPGMKYFDFGTSNEDNGKILNESLICHKEGFGGRAICYDTYIITI